MKRQQENPTSSASMIDRDETDQGKGPTDRPTIQQMAKVQRMKRCNEILYKLAMAPVNRISQLSTSEIQQNLDRVSEITQDTEAAGILANQEVKLLRSRSTKIRNKFDEGFSIRKRIREAENYQHLASKYTSSSKDMLDVSRAILETSCSFSATPNPKTALDMIGSFSQYLMQFDAADPSLDEEDEGVKSVKKLLMEKHSEDNLNEVYDLIGKLYSNLDHVDLDEEHPKVVTAPEHGDERDAQEMQKNLQKGKDVGLNKSNEIDSNAFRLSENPAQDHPQQTTSSRLIAAEKEADQQRRRLLWVQAQTSNNLENLLHNFDADFGRILSASGPPASGPPLQNPSNDLHTPTPTPPHGTPHFDRSQFPSMPSLPWHENGNDNNASTESITASYKGHVFQTVPYTAPSTNPDSTDLGKRPSTVPPQPTPIDPTIELFYQAEAGMQVDDEIGNDGQIDPLPPIIDPNIQLVDDVNVGSYEGNAIGDVGRNDDNDNRVVELGQLLDELDYSLLGVETVDVEVEEGQPESDN